MAGPAPGRSRGALLLAAAVVALGVALLIGARGIGGDAQYGGVGPAVFPVIIGLGLALSGAAYAVQAWRGAGAPDAGEHVDRRAVGLVVLGLVLAIALITVLGFAAAAAALFALTARALGSRRPLRDLLVGLALGLVVFFVFARGLGVSLPGGPLSGGPEMAPTPPTLGSGPAQPGRSSVLRIVGGGPEMAPTPPTLGSGPAQRGRSSVLRIVDGGPEMAPTPPTLGSGPAQRGRSSMLRLVHGR